MPSSAAYSRYQMTVSRKRNHMVTCRECASSKMTLENYLKKHVLDIHRIDLSSKCPFCMGQFQWNKKTTRSSRVNEHRMECIKNLYPHLFKKKTVRQPSPLPALVAAASCTGCDAERKAIIEEREAWDVERKDKSGEREKLNAERESINAETEEVKVEKESKSAEREEMDTEREDTSGHRKEMNVKREQICAQKEDIRAETEEMNAEREDINAEKGPLNEEKEAVANHREQTTREELESLWRDLKAKNVKIRQFTTEFEAKVRQVEAKMQHWKTESLNRKQLEYEEKIRVTTENRKQVCELEALRNRMSEWATENKAKMQEWKTENEAKMQQWKTKNEAKMQQWKTENQKQECELETVWNKLSEIVVGAVANELLKEKVEEKKFKIQHWKKILLKKENNFDV